MDGFNQVKEAGACAMVMSCICGLAMCGGWITFMVYLGRYGYNNPDLPAVYGVASGAETLYPDVAAAEAASAIDISDVHGHMHAWFLWGFWNQLLPILTGLVAALGMLLSPALGSCLGGLGMCGFSCGGLVWWIIGMVWRFNAAGSFASGDSYSEMDGDFQAAFIADQPLNQVSSGNFMGIYYLITWICMGVSCGCGILCALGACIASMCCK